MIPDFQNRTRGGFRVRNVRVMEDSKIYTISAEIGNHSSHPLSDNPEDWKQETFTANGRCLTWKKSKLDLIKIVTEPAIARRSLTARCPACDAANTICLAPVELNQAETKSLESIMSASDMTQLYVAPTNVKCVECKTEFKIVVSDEYYYEER